MGRVELQCTKNLRYEGNLKSSGTEPGRPEAMKFSTLPNVL